MSLPISGFDLLLFGGVFVTLAATALFSGVETGVWSLNRVRLRMRVEQGEPAAKQLAALMEQPDDVVIMTVLGNNIADYINTACLSLLLLRVGASQTWVELLNTAIATPLILVFGAILPKHFFQSRTDALMYPLSGVLRALTQLFRWTGLIYVLRRVPAMLLRWVDPAGAAIDDDLRPGSRMVRLVYEGAARGGLSTFQRDTFQRIMNVSSVRVGAVMVPLKRAALVPLNISRDDFLRIARMAHFSRLPVYTQSPQDAAGVVTVFDVLTDPQRAPVRTHVQPALILSVTDTVSAALLRLQQARQFMALVRDRRGRCVGLLTMKDLVEEIIGDLEVW